MKLLKVLVAEPDPFCRRMFEGMLGNWGFDIVAVRDGAEAWTLLESQELPGLVIAETAMPTLSGLDLCRKIRQDARTAALHVLMLVRRGRTQDVFAASLDAGADDYMSHPFDPEELHARLRVGLRMMRQKKSLTERVRELEESLRQFGESEEELVRSTVGQGSISLAALPRNGKSKLIQ